MKWPCRMLEVVCATICAGDSACDTGVVNGVPTPAAVAPMITILPGVFAGRDLAREHVVERVDGKGGAIAAWG